MKQKKMKKRLLSSILAIMFILSLLPTSALAMVGPLTVPEQYDIQISSSVRSIGGAASNGTYYMLHNDYITFILRPDGTSSTLPTRSLNATFKANQNGDWAKYVHHIPVTETHKFYAAPGMDLALLNGCKTAPSITMLDTNKLQAVYKITAFDKPVTFTMTYEIVRLDNGKTSGEYGDDIVEYDPDDPGRTWGVRAIGKVSYIGSSLYSSNSDDDSYGTAIFSMQINHQNFAKNPVQNSKGVREQGAIQLSTSTTEFIDNVYKNVNKRHFWNSSTKMPLMSVYYGLPDGSITEVFTDSFGTGNQFVATSADYSGAWMGTGEQISGVQGHAISSVSGGYYGDYIEYKSNTLSVYSSVYMFKQDGATEPEYTLDGLWGFRDLYTDSDSDAPSDESYYQEVTTGSHLGFVKDSNGTIELVSGSMDELKTQYSDGLVAVFRGQHSLKGTEYHFFGNVALSPSVTVTSNLTENPSITVSEDGNVTLGEGVGISCPSFQFYTGPSDGVAFDFANSSVGTLNLAITPEKNSSVLCLDIPGATSKMEGALLGVDGKLTLTGTMGISTPIIDIADIELNRVGMGYNKKGQYKVNGIEASGDVNIPDIIGFPTGSASADINTFDGEEKYHFELEMEIPSLFETEASLTLVRLKNGSLCPDDLELFVGSDMGGIPLVAPIVVAELTGVGGGFSNLAQSIDGDYFGVPPAKVSLQASAEVLQMLEGRAAVTAGLGTYAFTLGDVEFLGLDLGAQYYENAYLQYATRKWRGEPLGDSEIFTLTYHGIAIGGSKHLEVHLPSEDCNIINVSSMLSLDAFAGAADGPNTPPYLYFELNGDGKIAGSVNVPKKLGDIPVPFIGGEEIVGTKLDLSYEGWMLKPVSKSDVWNDGVETASHNATISWKTTAVGLEIKAIARFGNKDLMGSVGDHGGIYNFGTGAITLFSHNETDDMFFDTYVVADVEQLGSTEEIQLMGIDVDLEMLDKLEAAGINITQNGSDENSYTITLNDIADTDHLLFSLTPKAAADNADVETMFDIQKDGDIYSLTLEDYDEEGQSIVPNANAYVSASGYDEITGENVTAALVTKLNGAGTYTISAEEAFDISVMQFETGAYIDDNGEVKELKDDKNYVIRTYLVGDDGDYHTIGADIVPSNDYDVTSTDISDEQDKVKSGTYKKVYRLYEVIADEETATLLEDESDSFAMKQGMYVTLDTYEGEEISVTNPNEIPAPTDVTADAVGSEILRASWTAPDNVPDGKSIDGYMVTIYEKDGDEWKSTGTGYEVRADENGNIPTTIDMALTIGGTGELENGMTDENALLEANKYYRVSVAALSDMTADFDGDGELETASSRSADVYSDEDGVYIEEATPPTLTYSPEPEVIEGANVKTLFVMPGDYITVMSSELSEISAVRMDIGTELASASDTDMIDVEVPEFEGNLMIQIDAKDAEGDRVRDYISLKKDNVAPVITFNSESFTADDEGNFTITGTTEAGAEIIVNNDNGNIAYVEIDEEPWYEDCYSITQEEDGTFTMTGVLAEETKGAGHVSGGIICMQAKDKAGNISDLIFTSVVYEEEITDPDEPSVEPGDEDELPFKAVDVVIESSAHGTTVSGKFVDEDTAYENAVIIISYLKDGIPYSVQAVDVDIKNGEIEIPDSYVAITKGNITVAGISVLVDVTSLEAVTGEDLGTAVGVYK